MKNMLPPETLPQIQSLIELDGIQKIVVGAVIQYDSDEILLLERVSDDFMGGLVELPSGTVDPGEEVLEALQRELEEETGLQITMLERYMGSFDYISGSGKKTRQLNFLIGVSDTPVVLNPEEHSQFFRIKPQGAFYAELNISDETRRIIASI